MKTKLYIQRIIQNYQERDKKIDYDAFISQAYDYFAWYDQMTFLAKKVYAYLFYRPDYFENYFEIEPTIARLLFARDKEEILSSNYFQKEIVKQRKLMFDVACLIYGLPPIFNPKNIGRRIIKWN